MLELLDRRIAEGRPLRVGLIGAGTFGTMLLGQARRLDGVEIVAVADLSVDRARAAIHRAGFESDDVAVTDDALGLVERGGLDVVVEATGAPVAALAHAAAAIDQGCHVVMVTVEADVLAGPVLAERARRAGLVYSLAYGDQPALICELVDWARASGLDVVCAGKGTKHLPAYHRSTPDEVWEHYGLTQGEAEDGGYDPRMFNSFLDGTKSAVEMAAVCNATGLLPQADGLAFPPCAAEGLAQVCIPRADGGVLSRRGTVEVVSCLERDGTPVQGDLRWGVFVTFEAPTEQVSAWFRMYGLATDASGRFAALYRPYHLIGLETTVSVLSAALLGEATGEPRALVADVVAVAKRDLDPGTVLDGEGGSTVYGALVPADRSLAEGLLPVGLAARLRVPRSVAAGTPVRWDDVDGTGDETALALRREAERLLR
jgi:predicted homoserine dehydrogenase-like protein